MPVHTLYAFVDGADLEDVAELLAARFSSFVGSHHWLSGRVSVINRRHGIETCTQPGDLPLWDLGVTLELPDVGGEPQDWFSDVEQLARFLGTLHRETGRDFVIGIFDTKTGIADDLFHVTSDIPDIQQLRTIVGV